MSTSQRRLGKYELHERLGRGGMAEVWKALDTQLQRYVAIKFLHTDLRTDPNFMTRFVREAQAIASLRHPNIIQIHDFQASSESDNTAYMVMNYIEGPTMAEYIHDTSHVGKFPPLADIAHLFTSISSAIDYAHRRGMIHRDIKPTNIMLDKRRSLEQQMGKPILMDFGIVKLLGASVSTLTGAGALIGTPLYMSPEQAQGHPGNERSDIYSLGVILYEICTGVRPFQGDNPSFIMLQHITATPTPPDLINPYIPPALAAVILRSLAKDPMARFPTASSMATGMLEALGMSLPPILHTSPTRGDSVSGISSTTHSQSNSTPVERITPSSPKDSFPPYVATPPLPQFTTSTNGKQNILTTPTGTIPPITNAGQHPAAITPVLPPSTIASPEARVAWWKRKKALLVVSVIAVIFVLVGASLGSFFLLSQKEITSNPTNLLVGQAYFISSGQVSDQNSIGVDDELQISLHNIPVPAAGKSYYAWLLSDENQSPPQSILLGRLTIDQGTANFPYLHDQQSTNLLEHYSQFLITEEDANSTPSRPSADNHTWRYYAKLPQTPDGSVVNMSALDYIRYLLVRAPHGGQDRLGLDIQFLRNTHSVLTASSSAIDFWYKKDAHSIRNQVISILDYLDGPKFIGQDVPAGTPLLVNLNQAQTALLSFSSNLNPNSYFILIDNELNYILDSPGITPAMSSIVNQVHGGLSEVQKSLNLVYQNARLLIHMSDAQLLQASAHNILNTMDTEAGSAYSVIDPSTNQPQSGALWVHTQIQNLATFDIKMYP